MNNDEKQLLKQIKELHSQILKDSHDSLQRAIKLGGILDDFKETVGHGHFIDWVNTYLPFSERTSRNYMSLFRHKDSIKEQNITSLLQAYKLIVNCNNYNTTVKRQEMKERRAEFADRDTKYNNPHSFINKVVCGDCCKVMDKMLEKGMQGKFSMILTSPPYNAGFNYGKLFKDSKPYSEYLDYLMQPFPYYLELLRLGGRVCYILGSMVQNSQRESQGDYNHQLIVDLCYRVRETYPSLRHFNSIIWDKNKKGRNPLNTKFGSFASPLSPV